jgi:hypothetical protein
MVDYHFPTITIKKMAKMPFIPDPRYEANSEKQFEVYRKITEDINLYKNLYLGVCCTFGVNVPRDICK